MYSCQNRRGKTRGLNFIILPSPLQLEILTVRYNPCMSLAATLPANPKYDSDKHRRYYGSNR